MASNNAMIKRLITALNRKGTRIMYCTSQFWSETEERAVTVYHIKQAVWDDDREKFSSIELYTSPSQIQLVLYLRDLR